MSLSEKTRRWLSRNAPVSLRGKTAVVTGANSGVGFKTAETLLYLGADVVLACRNPQRAAEARDTLAADYPGSNISVLALDLADLSSIRAFAGRVREQGLDIHIFVNNAGVFHQPGKKTREGLDLVIGTNYFGVYALTEALLPYLSELPHDVVYVNTISMVHKIARIDYDDFYCTKDYRPLPVYARSKICLAKYTYYRAQQLSGSNVRMYMNHPGIAITPLGVNAVGPRYAGAARRVAPLFNSPEKSSLAIAYILSHPLPVGSIVGPAHGFGGWGYPRPNRILRRVRTGAGQLIAFTEKEIRRVSAENRSI